MAVNVHRLLRPHNKLEARREEFLQAQESKLGAQRAEASPLGALALIAIFGLGAFWVTGVLLWALIQFLPSLG